MALVAIKNGGLWGVGLGESMQKQYYLPECHTDFIFAVGAEELGLFFSIAVIILFLAFFCISVYIARNASDRFGRFLVIGMAFIIFFQAVFNLGVVCEALPTKGMALPFFSYGGTSLMLQIFEVGIILSISRYASHKKI
jgi:cell division protein FtsW